MDNPQRETEMKAIINKLIEKTMSKKCADETLMILASPRAAYRKLVVTKNEPEKALKRAQQQNRRFKVEVMVKCTHAQAAADAIMDCFKVEDVDRREKIVYLNNTQFYSTVEKCL